MVVFALFYCAGYGKLSFSLILAVVLGFLSTELNGANIADLDLLFIVE